MKLEIPVKDSHGNDLEIGDVLFITYPNEHINELLVLYYDDRDYCLRLCDMHSNWYAFKPVLATGIYKVANLVKKPELKALVGRHDYSVSRQELIDNIGKIIPGYDPHVNYQ